MKFTIGWLKRFLDTQKTLDQICQALIKIGFEVDHVYKSKGEFIVAEILEAKKHPNADTLQICKVCDGKETSQIVCGAPNARSGIKVVLAKIGAIIPVNGIQIKEATIRGYQSFGMMCSAAELGMGQDSDGIIELSNNYSIGQEFKIDPVIEIDVTPNRGDALCIYGIARELSAAGFGKLIHPKIPQTECFDANFNVEIKNKECCKKFAGILLKDIQNCKTPDYICQFLSAAGIKQISVVVDILNYVMLAFGTPMHAYDADKIDGNSLFVKKIIKEEEFDALDDKKYILPEGTIIVCDQSRIQCAAGIIGSLYSQCTPQTKNVFLECANFNHIDIALAKRKIGIETESSYRFERQIDCDFVENSLKIAADIILKTCGGKSSQIIKAEQQTQPKKIINFDPDFFTKLTGTSLEHTKMQDILQKLGFVVKNTDKNWQVIPPAWRNDITNQNCIVEEILRINGYQNLKSQCFFSKSFVPYKKSKTELAKQVLVARGMHEVITWSFMDSKKNLEETKLAKIKNPITKNLDAMRPTLAYNLLDVATQNCKNDIDCIKIFECGKIYQNHNEEFVISGLRHGKSAKRNIYFQPHDMDFFDAKSDCIALLDAFCVNNIKFYDTDIPAFCHPKRSASIWQNNNNIGYVAELHPNIAKGKTIPFFELFIEKILYNRQNKEYLPSKYPQVHRDFAFVFQKNVKLQKIKDAIFQCSELIKDVHLFDKHEDKEKYKEKISLAFAVTLCSAHKTLSSAEIDDASNCIINELGQSFGAILRKDYSC